MEMTFLKWEHWICASIPGTDSEVLITPKESPPPPWGEVLKVRAAVCPPRGHSFTLNHTRLSSSSEKRHVDATERPPTSSCLKSPLYVAWGAWCRAVAKNSLHKHKTKRDFFLNFYLELRATRHVDRWWLSGASGGGTSADEPLPASTQFVVPAS